MKKILTFVIILHSLLLASNSDNEKSRTEKQIQKEIETEKKYAEEQTFYTEKDYDFKGAEVNKDSLKNLPHQEVDDLDMDDVYD